MNPPQTDAEYSDAARAALNQIHRWFANPQALLSADAQERFIYMVIEVVKPVCESEPHLRGALVKSVADMQAYDVECVRRERDLYQATAINLLNALKRQPLPRGIEHRKDRERLIEVTEKTLA